MQKPLFIRDGPIGETLMTLLYQKCIGNRSNLKKCSHLFVFTNLFYRKQDIHKIFNRALPNVVETKSYKTKLMKTFLQLLLKTKFFVQNRLRTKQAVQSLQKQSHTKLCKLCTSFVRLAKLRFCIRHRSAKAAHCLLASKTRGCPRPSLIQNLRLSKTRGCLKPKVIQNRRLSKTSGFGRNEGVPKQSFGSQNFVQSLQSFALYKLCKPSGTKAKLWIANRRVPKQSFGSQTPYKALYGVWTNFKKEGHTKHKLCAVFGRNATHSDIYGKPSYAWQCNSVLQNREAMPNKVLRTKRTFLRTCKASYQKFLAKPSWCKASLSLAFGSNAVARSSSVALVNMPFTGSTFRFYPNAVPSLQNKVLQGKSQTNLRKVSVLSQQSSSNSMGIDDKVTRTIVITSGKGGVGKTTTTANLGMSIARLGYRVTLIDADIGLRNLDLLLGLENRVLYTAMDIFEGDCRLDQALIRDKRLKNLCLLAISKNRQRYNVTRQKMDSLISSICALGSDFILIDCPAGIDIGFINAISPAQEALIITTPEITAMRDADRVAGLLEANGIYNAKLLINRVRPDMIQRHDMMSVQDVQDVLGIPLLGAIPEDLNVIISTNRGEPLVLSKKLSLSGVAFENAARRLVGKQEYLIDLKSPYKNIFHKMKALLFNT